MSIVHDDATEDRLRSIDMIRGAWAGFILASGEIEGWDAVLRHVQELAGAARVPARIQKPELHCVRGGKA